MDSIISIRSKNLNKKGLAAFFYKSNEKEILFKEYIKHPLEFDQYPTEIKEKRNSLIYLLCIQILASTFALLYIFFRRKFIYLLINGLSIGLALVGLKGIVEMSSIYLIIHCIFTTALTGSFFVFQIIEYLLVSDKTLVEDRRLGDSLLLIIFSIPYLFDAFTGITNFIFLYGISQYNYNKKKDCYNKYEMKEEMRELENFDESEVKNHIDEEKLCIICCTNEKNAVNNPCGHLLCCLNCANIIMNKKTFLNVPRCPICREEILNIIRLIE